MRTLGLFPLCFTLLVGCGGGADSTPSTANDSGVPKPGADDSGLFGDTGGPPASTDSGIASSDTGGSVPGCTPTSASDDLDDDGIDSNCDGADGKVGFDVYVSPMGLDTNEGSPSAPKATIAAALMKARVTGGAVVLSSGDYELTALEASGKWRIVGGYDKSFVGKPVRSRTGLTVPATGLLISGTAVDGTLAHLQIMGASPSSADEPTAYAIRAKVERIRLDDVTVRPGDGHDGKDGTPGEPGIAGLGGNEQYSKTGWTCDGTAAADNQKGAGPGQASSDGKASGSVIERKPGQDGSAGIAAADGADASKSPKLVDDLLAWNKGTGGGSNGTPGFGGAGGAATKWGLGWGGSYGYMDGHGGWGGCPGKGGHAATSGGSSVAVLLISGELTLTRSSIEAGFGGIGGAGGAGGKGGTGGVAGTPIDQVGVTCSSASDAPTDTNCGRWAGAGGAGGAGGRGGGGAGGWSVGIVKVGTATSTIDTATTFKLGAAGSGGLGKSGGYAPSGEKRTELSL